MIESQKQPLLLQLLQERRKFAHHVVDMYAEKGVTPEILQECEQDEARKRLSGSYRAVPLGKQLVKRGLLTEKDVAAAMKTARASQEAFLAAKDLESVRKAQQEAGSTLERVLAKLEL